MGEGEIQTEMPRHVDMHNLLGDPALVLARPDDALTLEQLDPVPAGAELVVRGASGVPRQAVVTVTLATDRKQSAHPASVPGETPLERYARANDRVVATTLVRSDGQGRFEARLRVPEATPPAATWSRRSPRPARAGPAWARPG